MRVVLVIGLVFVVFHLDKVGVDCGGIKGQRDERVDGGGLRDDFEGP